MVKSTVLQNHTPNFADSVSDLMHIHHTHTHTHTHTHSHAHIHTLAHTHTLTHTHRVCLLHHFFRIDQGNHLTFFETYYFVMVTMSTVGYGDFSPGHWTGRLLITVFVISALIYLIPHLEKLFEAFQMQQKLHNSVNFKKAGLKHILICATQLKPLVLRDFLTEFYSDPDHLVRILLIPTSTLNGHFQGVHLGAKCCFKIRGARPMWVHMLTRPFRGGGGWVYASSGNFWILDSEIAFLGKYFGTYTVESC